MVNNDHLPIVETMRTYTMKTQTMSAALMIAACIASTPLLAQDKSDGKPWERQVYFGEQHLHTANSPDALSRKQVRVGFSFAIAEPRPMRPCSSWPGSTACARRAKTARW